MQLTSFILGLGIGLVSARFMARSSQAMPSRALGNKPQPLGGEKDYNSSGSSTAYSTGNRTDTSASPNAGERLQQSHLAGANAGIGAALPNAGNDTRLFADQSYRPDDDGEPEAITPGLRDFARGA